MEQFSSAGRIFMFRSFCLALMVSAMAVPAVAADLRQEADKIGAAYAEAVAKHDAAAIAALYTKDPIWVGPSGQIKTDVKATYEENFKNGENKIDGTIDGFWPQGNDAALAKGTTNVTFNNDPPFPIYWTAVYAREGGQLKIKMLTVGITPPPPKETTASVPK
jgi:ketosteroid isomerase-like protein